ncbi:MAG: hypothetical protein IIB07_07685 [Bacteroidetes bacterium]|nr:hypothetical protein [Bacteroidota bacterium]
MQKNKFSLFSIFIFLITIFIPSCSNYNNGYKTDNQKASFLKTAEDKYSDNISYLFSSDSAFVICYKTEIQTTNNSTPQSKFFIYDLNNDKIVFEDKGRSDKIEWIDNTKLRVLKRPGIISVDPKKNLKLLGYIYDLKNNKKLPLSKPGNNQLQ